MPEKRSITLPLIISEAEEIQEGIYETRLSHPKLDGYLSFVHSASSGREEVLKSLDENLVAGVLNVIDLVGGLINVGNREVPKNNKPG